MLQLQSYLTVQLDRYQTQKANRYNRQRLLSMDDRSLSDIGVTRGDLMLEARKQPSPAKLRAKALKAERNAQKAAIKELRAMSDADLSDLGITRGNIVEAVRYGRGGLVEQPMSNAARKISRSEQARAINELSAMSDAQLRDMGVYRGDIKELVRNGKKGATEHSLPGKLANGLFSVFQGPVVVSNATSSVAANTDDAPKPPRNPQSLTAA